MTRSYPKKGTQEDRVLQRLLEANGAWLHGDRVFFQELRFRQYHRAIFNLENRFGWKIEHSDGDEHGFKSYRILQEEQPTLFAVEQVNRPFIYSDV